MAQAPQLIQGRALEPSDSPEYVASAPMSFEEFLGWDYEGGLVEWVEGRAYVYVSATLEHQLVVDFLSRLMGCWAEATQAGTVITAPYAMQSAEGAPGREPDIVFVTSEHQQRLQSKFLSGPPDLIIEVVSPDSVSRDRAVKRREYGAAGVREYWVVDVRPNVRRAEFFVLDGRELVPREASDGVYRSVVANGFWVRPEWLWEFGRQLLPTLAEVLGRPLFQAGA
jgi:Uma2 family endonuclease